MEALSTSELIINTSHRMTREEFLVFNADDTYLTIMDKIQDFLIYKMKHSGVQLLGRMELDCLDFWLSSEGYLNNFAALKILKRNLLQLLNPLDKRSIFYMEKAEQK